MTRVNPTMWRVTLAGWPGIAVQYKYVLGSGTNPPDWSHVEKTTACGERTNRAATLNPAPGPQNIADIVEGWAAVSPC